MKNGLVWIFLVSKKDPKVENVVLFHCLFVIGGDWKPVAAATSLEWVDG